MPVAADHHDHDAAGAPHRRVQRVQRWCPSESGQHRQKLIMRMKSRWFATAVSASFCVDDAGTMAPESRCRCGTGELPPPGPSQGKRRISHAAGRPLCPTKRQVNGHDSSRRGMDLAFHGAPGSPSADVGQSRARSRRLHNIRKSSTDTVLFEKHAATFQSDET